VKTGFEAPDERVREKMSEFEQLRANGRTSECARVLASSRDCEQTGGRATTSECEGDLAVSEKVLESVSEFCRVRANWRASEF